MKEDLKPTQQDIIEANNRVAKQNLEDFRQNMRAYLMAGGKLTFNWNKKVKKNEL